jgi:hypothetical protein
VTTISNWHGNYTTLFLVQGSQAKLYFIYPAVDSIVCKSFILPSVLPPPPVLSKDVLEASGFNAKGLQPLRDDVLLQATTLPKAFFSNADASPAAFAQSRTVLAAGARTAQAAAPCLCARIA